MTRKREEPSERDEKIHVSFINTIRIRKEGMKERKKERDVDVVVVKKGQEGSQVQHRE